MKTIEKNMEHELLVLFRKMIRIDLSAYLQELSREEFYMLDLLSKQIQEKEIEGMKVSSIAEALDISSPAVSRMLGGMERKGYILRKVNPHNRRNTIVKITKNGQKIYDKTESQMNCLLDHVTKRVGQEDMEELLRLWNRVAEAFLEETKFELKI